ncbi:hypothetical protein [Streptomyces sp. TLI_171]|uniref:hypothetical protein n=1 Tax=Streptomyces sp. TLI_171 TaxID=1938859 RepID=UPI000C18DC23|nr:hypothetical protein [Streptomyces sp. TLI_171]RKE17007.1 hypothetical protein BX266_0257 [Streptomyces sp. TLI_171]
MIFRKKKAVGLSEHLTALEQGVAARDSERTERAFGAILGGALQAATGAEHLDAGPRLAALLPGFPPVGPRSVLATAAGFCVEQGADPAVCAEPILTTVQEEVRAALDFARRWPDAELPAADVEAVEGLVARLGGDEYEALRLALAWCGIEEWQAPALAVLCRSGQVRQEFGAALLPLARELEALGRHDLKCLVYALAVLDEEPLVVLHRPTGTGYEVRIGGIGDNFQLHTLLAHVLIGGGHLPGDAPSAASVRLATDPAPARGRSDVTAFGSFDLLAPDGGPIWNEGLPDDIPVVDGRRLLVLDTPAYGRGWNADRFFPLLPGRADLLRVLPAEETAAWFARTTVGSAA